MKKLKKVLIEVSSKKFCAVIVSMLFVLNVASPIFAMDDYNSYAGNTGSSNVLNNTEMSESEINDALKKISN